MRGVVPPSLPPGGVDEVSSAAREVMSVDDVTAGVAPANAVRVRGRLFLPADQAWRILADRLKPSGWTPMLRRQERAAGDELLALPLAFNPGRQRTVLAAILFALTVLSCLFTGAQMVEGLTGINWNLLDGLPFAAALLAILVAHESAHYLVSRRLGSPTSWPYFIPMPFPIGPFGTLGAVIASGSPIRNRRHLLAVGASGPLAGLVLAIPILILGLNLSHVQPLPTSGYTLEGNSLLYATLKYLVFGRVLPAEGMDVFIHPVAYAGWAGLLITGLNLMPIGQLDGGHIAYAFLGRKAARVLGWVMVAAAALLILVWPNWWLWVGLLLLASFLQDVLLDEITELTGRQRVAAALMLVLFILVFVPIPWTEVR